jgi:hypothetical protein
MAIVDGDEPPFAWRGAPSHRFEYVAIGHRGALTVRRWQRYPPDLHWIEAGDETMLDAGARVLSLCIGGWRLLVSNCVVSRNAIRITNMMTRVLVAALRVGEDSWRRALEAPGRGKSAIKRAASASESRRADVLSGSAEINKVILSVALSLGMRARLAASSQGSTSNRASAEMTLSSIPFRSSPIGANKKSSNSDRWREAEADLVISVKEFIRLWRR